MTDPALQMLAYELAIIFGILALYLGYKQYKKSKAVNAQASASVKKIKQLKKRRLDDLTSVLSEKYGLADEALTQTAEAIQKHEQLIYKSQVALFVEQEDKTLKAAPQQIEKLVDKCLALFPVGQVSVKPNAEQSKLGGEDLGAMLAQTNLKLDSLIEDVKHIKPAPLTESEAIEPEANDNIPQEEDASELLADLDDTEAETEIVDEAVDEETIEVTKQVEADVEEIEIVGSAEGTKSLDVQEEKNEEMVSADDIDALLAEMETEHFGSDGIDLAKSDDEPVEEIASVFARYQDTDNEVLESQSSLEEVLDDTVTDEKGAETEEQGQNLNEPTQTQSEQDDIAPEKIGEQIVDEEQQLADMMADIAQDLASASELLDNSEAPVKQQENSQDELAGTKQLATSTSESSENDSINASKENFKEVEKQSETVEESVEIEMSETDNEDTLDEQQVAELREQVRQRTQKIQQANSQILEKDSVDS